MHLDEVRSVQGLLDSNAHINPEKDGVKRHWRYLPAMKLRGCESCTVDERATRFDDVRQSTCLKKGETIK